MAGSLWASRAEQPFLAPCRWLLFLVALGRLRHLGEVVAAGSPV